MFTKAEKRQAKLRLAISGPSGSGKTYSSLMIAMGLGAKIAMLDTEHGSGELYADLADYDVARLEPPYTPDRYIQIIKGAEKAGYDVLIIDSLSHAWTGEGGVLDMHDKATQAQRGGNSYTAWRNVTPQHNALVDAILQSSMHIIATMRSKTAYDVIEDDKGKKKPVKIGLAPVQRDGMEYEFTVVLDLAVDGHVATSSKDRTRLFDGQYFVPSQKSGEQLKVWLESGAKIDIEAIGTQIMEAETFNDARSIGLAHYKLVNADQQKMIQEFVESAKKRLDLLNAKQEQEQVAMSV